MKKKLLALALSAVMMMGLSTTAFAATSATSIDASKTVTVANSGTAPSETYNFTVTEGENTDTAEGTTTPAIDDFTITDNGTYTITLPTYTSVGIYYYTIKETAGNTAGVDYDETEYTLKVTVTLENGEYVTYPVLYKGDNKVDSLSFENTYTAGKLTVTKEVTGNLGDTSKEFSFTVTFSNSDDAISWTNAITVSSSSAASDVKIDGNTVTFTLSDGDSIIFENIPEGISYTVTEDSYTTDGYTTTYDANQNGTMGSDDISTTITNDKTEDVDTGINLDSLPYVMILAIVLLGAAYVISRRRLSDRY